MKKAGNAFTCGHSNEDSAFTLRNIVKAQRAGYMGSDFCSFNDVKEDAQTYQDLYDHYQNYLNMIEMLQRSNTTIPDNILSLPYLEKEKAILMYETLPDKERLHQETMDGY